VAFWLLDRGAQGFRDEFRQEVTTMAINVIPTSVPTAACAPTVGGYLTAVATTGLLTGSHQVQLQPTRNAQLTVAAVPTGPSGRRQIVEEQAQRAQAWLRHRGASVATASNGSISSEGSVRTTIPTVKKPFMDAARGVPPRGRPV
jgi:hypothetical protein